MIKRICVRTITGGIYVLTELTDFFCVKEIGKHIRQLILWKLIRSLEILNSSLLVVDMQMMVLLIELYLFIPLPVTLTIFHGHGSAKQFHLKNDHSYLIKLKLHRIVKYIK